LNWRRSEAGFADAPLRFGAAPMSESLVEFRAAGKTFANGTVALDGLSFGVGEHEFVSLVGPSGCGKSTALRMMAGLAAPTSGSITGSLPRTGAGLADIGFVFQEPTLMPWARVAENVYLPLKLKGVSRKAAQPRIQEALAMVGLADFHAAWPRELSGGMKMRVSIARALVTSPRLLLMDEPFAALDEMTRLKLNDDLLRLWAAQRWTVVFVTHSVYESVYLSSRVVVMAARPGRVVADLAINAPYPRDAEFRLSGDYATHCRAVSAALAGAGDAHG
jgi:NitT/TauT family transport system ATP-binding protein